MTELSGDRKKDKNKKNIQSEFVPPGTESFRKSRESLTAWVDNLCLWNKFTSWKKKLFLVFSHVIRRPYWCTQQRQNVAQVLHKNRIKFPKDFFHCCSLQQPGHCDVTWKPRIYVCIMNSPRQFQMSYFSPVVLLLFFDVRFTLGEPLRTFCNCKRLWKNRLLLCCSVLVSRTLWG